eukprot:TRINITY_DN8259_c0_g1_i10.p1 TRINITY_DN8259_c0_g1~~TRINITY_DN8259_c0_g1_i10.p1  ORF type:complete len:208 (+),score=-11.04 TRINITY_DN8259_c0_g1_i10:688-1311(+)
MITHTRTHLSQFILYILYLHLIVFTCEAFFWAKIFGQKVILLLLYFYTEHKLLLKFKKKEMVLQFVRKSFSQIQTYIENTKYLYIPYLPVQFIYIPVYWEGGRALAFCGGAFMGKYGLYLNQQKFIWPLFQKQNSITNQVLHHINQYIFSYNNYSNKKVLQQTKFYLSQTTPYKNIFLIRKQKLHHYYYYKYYITVHVKYIYKSAIR